MPAAPLKNIIRPLALAALAGALALAAAPSASAGPTPSAYGLTPIAPDATFGGMVDFQMLPGSDDEAIVVLQNDQTIRRVTLSGAGSATLFGDLSDYVSSGGEQGLLSAAFSPDFANDGRIYVYYTEGSPNPSVLSRFQVEGGQMVTDGAGAETRILEVPQFASNHNGGRIVFGADDYLYLSLGDGGGANDPNETGQDLGTLLGKVLRINVTDVNTPPNYTIPPDNPFGPGIPGRDEIYAYGLRNPWRMSMDRATGKLWLGDVGQGAWEEVQPVDNGANYGWDCYEGFVQFEPAGCAGSGFTFPRAVYDHGGGNCAVTGGYVYRGTAMPELYGWYIYADYCSGRIWAVHALPGASTPPVLLDDTPYSISSFGETADGELVVVTFSNQLFLLHNDGDGDGLGAHEDNCPSVSNAGGQGDDVDGDLAGDTCDAPGSGNLNCDNAVNSVDALVSLRSAAALGVLQNDPCLDMGQPRILPPPDNKLMGDVNCDTNLNSVDALLILRASASLSVNLPGGCPVIKP